MDLERYVVDCVVLEGRSVRDVGSSVGMSKSWVQKQLALYRDGGYEALGQRKRGPKIAKNRTSAEIEDAIVSIREGISSKRSASTGVTNPPELPLSGLRRTADAAVRAPSRSVDLMGQLSNPCRTLVRVLDQDVLPSERAPDACIRGESGLNQDHPKVLRRLRPVDIDRLIAAYDRSDVSSSCSVSIELPSSPTSNDTAFPAGDRFAS